MASELARWEAELAQLSVLLASADAYTASLATGELPAALAGHIEAALAAPRTSPARLEQISAALVQMIEMGETNRGDHAMSAASAWAMDALLALEAPEHARALGESPALQRLQALTSTTASSPPGSRGEPGASAWERWLRDDTRAGAMDPTAAAAALDLLATATASDAEFLSAAEALLGRAGGVSLGRAFLDRISSGALLDGMALQSKVLVWANDLASWRRQLRRWLLAAHREPLRSIGAVLAVASPTARRTRADVGESVEAWAAACQRHSQLYVTLVAWAHEHAALLGSCRSVELVGTLARATRPPHSTDVFNRSVLHESWAADPAFWTARDRVLRFAALDRSLRRLERECAAAPAAASSRRALQEWVGAVERPHLALEAMEMLLRRGEDRSSPRSEVSHAPEALAAAADAGAARFLGWFYAHLSPIGSAAPSLPGARPTEEVAAVAMTLAADLRASSLESGARWLQSTRAAFATRTVLRLRLAWFWLLQRAHDAHDGGDAERRSDLLVRVLETIEYAFRRFAPADRKRAFQVEVTAQFVADLEWRSHAHWSTRSARTRAAMAAYAGRMGGVLDWLAKIVRLMHVEELKTRGGAANDVQHLTERLRGLLAAHD